MTAVVFSSIWIVILILLFFLLISLLIFTIYRASLLSHFLRRGITEITEENRQDRTCVPLTHERR